MRNENFDDITKKCKNIIENNDPIKSINKISNLNLQNGKNVFELLNTLKSYDKIIANATEA
jgi:stage III sporulation protein SpoIIIAA